MEIKDYFTESMQNSDGSFKGMFDINETQVSKKSIDIINGNGKRLLKIISKNEGDASEKGNYAQVKIIPFESSRVYIYQNIPSDPDQIRLKRFSNYEITYHGPTYNKETPIIHIKEFCNQKTKTRRILINNNFPVEEHGEGIIPILSYFEGKSFGKGSDEKIKNKGYIFRTPKETPSRVDIYISSANIDIKKELGGLYIFSFFCSPDYVLSYFDHALTYYPISKKIKVFRVNDYFIWVKCSVANYSGRSYIQVFSNEKYYESFSNRLVAWRNKDNSLTWSTIKEEEEKTC